MRHPTRLLAPVMAAAVLSLVAAGTALPQASAAPSCPLGLAPHQVTPAGATAFTMCSGKLASFDGTPLDSDLSLPPGASGAHPLIVMLNGWGSSKTDFEASGEAGNGTNTYDWNNVWFAEHGYAVLNYTARGFWDSCGKDPDTGYSYLTDPACSGKESWTHLADRRWEIHDTQYLVGLLVDAGVAAPAKVVVTGDSYGGGQSWLLALSQDQVMAPGGTLSAWKSPKGVPIRLAAAVPQYPWTDLAEALVDNGRESDAVGGAPPDGNHTDPIGVEKQSYVDGLYALGQAYAQYATAAQDPTADLPGWFAAITAGEPYSANPLVAAAVTQLRDYRSPFYLPVPAPGRQVPVLDIQGVTDPLFPAVQALQLQNRLNDASPGYPDWVVMGDLGHGYAANPHALWVSVNAIANSWLATVMSGGTPALAKDTAFPVECLAGQSAPTVSVSTPAGLATSIETFKATAGADTTSLAVTGPEAEAVDPIVNGSVGPGGCRTISTTTDPGVAAWTFTPHTAAEILGSPTVHVTVSMTGTDAELAARLWDIDPATGNQTLITRAVYRLSSASPTSTQQVALALWPTAWPLRTGDELKLELTQGDDPTWRADNLPSSLTLSAPTLTVPERVATSAPSTTATETTQTVTRAVVAGGLPDTGGNPALAWLGLPLLAAVAAGRRLRRR
jgi:dienelactone hydrolase